MTMYHRTGLFQLDVSLFIDNKSVNRKATNKKWEPESLEREQLGETVQQENLEKQLYITKNDVF
jgi:hypothetical protein